MVLGQTYCGRSDRPFPRRYAHWLPWQLPQTLLMQLPVVSVYTTALTIPAQMHQASTLPHHELSPPDDEEMIPPISSSTASEADSRSLQSNTSQDTINLPGASTDNIVDTYGATPDPLSTTPGMQRSLSASNGVHSSHILSTGMPAQRSISVATGGIRLRRDDSPVMNETLSVIDEHITDLNTPRSSLLGVEPRTFNDSGSDYSNNLPEHRLSYINGDETDEEEQHAHTEKEIAKWSPDQVAEYLKGLGVDSRHCEVFREQEISGEVLLELDQSQIFMKELDLGPVGRRLHTWHKIRAFQQELKSNRGYDSKSLSLRYYGGEASHSDAGRSVSRTSTNASMLPRIPSLHDRPNSMASSSQLAREAASSIQEEAPQIQLQTPDQSDLMSPSLISPSTMTPSQLSPSTLRPTPDSPRPSAASVRELNHSRRHSSADFKDGPTVKSNALPQKHAESRTNSLSVASHKKQSSFDRAWTMSGAIAAMASSRPSTALENDQSTHDPNSPESVQTARSSKELDRGYMSSGEIDNKKTRNVLRKRETASASHSRQSSFKDDPHSKKVEMKRHSRFGSGDSFRESLASMSFHGPSLKNRFRSSSIKENASSLSSPREEPSPVVTKLDYSSTPGMSTITPSPSTDSGSPSIGRDSPSKLPQKSPLSTHPRLGLRTVSDTVTASEKASVKSPNSFPSPIKESPGLSPTRTGSTTTTSGNSKSIEIDSPGSASKPSFNHINSDELLSRTTRRKSKSKKETSAYTKGLEKKPPKEQMKECDYSGWMKKKSPGIMTTWKPRLFILRGRRLSYYYTENDTEEKGLIDISSHRVLPAGNERMTGLHASFTGAKSLPTSPSNAVTPTINATEAAAQDDGKSPKSSADGIFIFKLVPPRAGLSKAVQFTKPTVHYFAVDNLQQGRLWMAALMKATIDRDETSPVTSTYNQKTISLAKARARKHRPPALMGPEDVTEDLSSIAETQLENIKSAESGLNIQGLDMGFNKADTASEEKEVYVPSSPVDSRSTTESTRSRGLSSAIGAHQRKFSFPKSPKNGSTPASPTAISRRSTSQSMNSGNTGTSQKSEKEVPILFGSIQMI